MKIILSSILIGLVLLGGAFAKINTAGNVYENFVLNQKLLVNDLSNGATFGHTVAIDNDTAVVGAWQDSIGRNKKQGSVYVFVRRNNAWINQAKLIAADGSRNEYFGQSVAIAGNTLVVGVPQKQVGKNKDQGAVYVFTREGDNWSKQVKLESSDGARASLFGSSVGISGEAIIVGSPGVDNYPEDKIPQAHGAAYVFTKVNDNWVEKQKITGDDKRTTAFGLNVAIDNKTAVISTSTDGSSANTLYIFSDAGTGWKKETKIGSPRAGSEQIATNGTANNLAIDGNTIIAGATQKSSKSNGAVFVYVRDGGKWMRQAKLVLKDGTKSDNFGWSADISGDRVIVGSSFSDQLKGSAFLFTRNMTSNGAVWTEGQKFSANDSLIGDQFGVGVGISGEKIIIGADNHDLKGRNGNEGVAYIFSPSSAVVSSMAQNNSIERGSRNIILLAKNARKNRYKIEQDGQKYYLITEEVEDPLTKKLLEGVHQLSYGCETPQTSQTREVAWSKGRSVRFLIACAVIAEPKILLLDEPTSN